MPPENQTPPEPQSPTAPEPVLPPAPSVPPVQPAGEDPGKGLAIAGLILAFFFSLLGLILSIIAKKKSSAAGFHNTIATVGIVLNAIFLVLGTLVFIAVLAAITSVSYTGIQERANTASGISSANTLLKYAEAFNVENGFYPTSMSEMNSSDTTKITDKEDFSVSFSPLTKATSVKGTGEDSMAVLNLYGCKQKGNIIAYWNHQTNREAYVTTINTFDESDCSIVVD